MISIGLDNPKNVTNVGAVLRAAGCFGVDSVFYTGARYDRAVKFATDTKNSINNIPLQQVDDLLVAVSVQCKIVVVELVEGAISLVNYQHPKNAYYVFGPEDSSLSQSVVDRADDVVYIPTAGCLNLAASVNIVLYDRTVKLKENEGHVGDDRLIRQSRDCRNRLKVSVK